jgi:RNA polymerase sigma-70 factor (ECF subfamily)
MDRLSTDADRLREDALIAAAREGNRDALEQLLERYQDTVFSFGLRMCGDSEDAKDVLQNTLLAAARSMPRFRGDASFSTWLYTIARRFCLKQRRRGRSAPALDVPLDDVAHRVVSQDHDPETLAGRTEMRRLLARALASLEPAMREVLVLRDIEGLSAAEVSKVTGASVAAVKSRLHRARAALGTRVLSLTSESRPPQADTCPDVLTALSTQIEGDLSATLCAELERHVEGCASCRSRCDALKQSLAACREAKTPVPESVTAAVRAEWRGMRA